MGGDGVRLASSHSHSEQQYIPGMPPHEDTFHYRIGRLARLFRAAEYSEVVLADGVLRLGFRDGRTETLSPDHLVPSVRRGWGVFWVAFDLRHRDGQRVRIAGIRRGDARALERILEAWLAPVRQRCFDARERTLQTEEALVTQLLGGFRYIRRSDVLAAAERLRASPAEIAELPEPSDAPPALANRCERPMDWLLLAAGIARCRDCDQLGVHYVKESWRVCPSTAARAARR